jgi:hypothetical protein
MAKRVRKEKVDYTPLIEEFIKTRSELRFYEKRYAELRNEVLALDRMRIPGRDFSLALIPRSQQHIDTVALKVDFGAEWYNSYCKDTNYYEIVVVSNGD